MTMKIIGLKTYLSLILIFGLLIGCADSGDFNFDETGGMIISFANSSGDLDYQSSIENRLKTYSRLTSSGYRFEKDTSSITITLPYFLDDNQLKHLLFDEGEITIGSGDKIFFNNFQIFPMPITLIS